MNVKLLTSVGDLVTQGARALNEVQLPNVTKGLQGLNLTPPSALVPNPKPITEITSSVLETTPPPNQFVDDVMQTTPAPNDAAYGAIDVEVLDETPLVPTPMRTPQPYSYRQEDGAGDIPGTDLAETPTKQLVDSSAGVEGEVPNTATRTWGERFEDAKNGIANLGKSANETFAKKLQEGRDILAKGGEAAEKWAKENPDAYNLLVGSGLVASGGTVGAVAGHNLGYNNGLEDSAYYY